MATVSIDPLLHIQVPENLQELVGGRDMLSVHDVQELYKSWPKNELRLHEFLSKCHLILPEPKLAPRNPELEARIQKLKAEQQAKEYQRMTNNVDPFRANSPEQDEKPISKQLQELNRYLLLILQFVLSLVSAFLFGYFAPYYFYGTITVGPRLLYGILSAFVVGIADLYFVLRHLLETEGVIKIDRKKE